MKQIDYAVRIRTINAADVNGAITPDQMSAWGKTEYPPKLGWELKSVEHIQTSADGFSVLLFFARYEDAK
jgi:hypothetical protein